MGNRRWAAKWAMLIFSLHTTDFHKPGGLKQTLTVQATIYAPHQYCDVHVSRSNYTEQA